MIGLPYSYGGEVSIKTPDLKKAVTIRIDRGTQFRLQRICITGCPDKTVIKFQFDTSSYSFETGAMYLGPMLPEVIIKDKLVIAFKVPRIPWWKFWRRSTNIDFILHGEKIFEEHTT